MARSLYLPYQATNPRTVRGAKKRGWHVVQVDMGNLKDRVTWMGLCIWSERTLGRYWIASYKLSEFAFESGADAVAFKLKWA